MLSKNFKETVIGKEILTMYGVFIVICYLLNAGFFVEFV